MSGLIPEFYYRQLWFSLIALSSTVISCNEEVQDVVGEQGYAFFPTKMGQYRIYEVEQILYHGSEADTSHYFLKETITDSLVAGDQSVSYLLKRYRSADSSFLSWVVEEVWTMRRTPMFGVVTENNIPFIKMVFPVKKDRSWDGNALNSMDEQLYRYTIIENYVLNGLEIPPGDVVRVVIEDIPENLVEQDQRSEIYARKIGLVEKDYISVVFCQSGCTPGEIEDGFIYRQRLVEYGEE